ncbi:MAG: hypothetical protein KIC80_03705 [Brachyspira sp.]|nr:hypothetical protein [Brachyspira sp.]
MIGSVGFGALYSSFLSQQSRQKNQQKQDLINKNYNEIYAHEAAHKAAGGALAGAIVIEKNADGIPVGGHVAIKMPSLNPANPKKTIDDANTVIRSAMAPSDPSAQDYRVASQARSIKAQAQGMLNKNQGKKLDYRA